MTRWTTAVVALVVLVVAAGSVAVLRLGPDGGQERDHPGASSEDGATEGEDAGDGAPEDDGAQGQDEAAEDQPAEVTASREITHETLWLCGPAAEEDACLGDLDATVVATDGSQRLEPYTAAQAPPVDCFYLYPTVSRAEGRNAPLEITDAVRDVARAQAARFGEVCRVVAPVYRQVTLQGLLTGGFSDQEARDLAFGDVLSAWNDHVATSGDRPFVLLGHSQGAQDLTRLLAERIEGDPQLRPRLVSALLLGGEVTVPVGEDVGGSFATVPACRTRDQTGCVVAYNSFAATPPAFAFFGRGGFGQEVLCVNPAAPSGGPATLTPYLPTDTRPEFDTPFVTAADAVTGECRTEGNLSWLQVDVDPALGLDEAAASADLGPAWGLHVGDVNLALGDLVALVRAQLEAAS